MGSMKDRYQAIAAKSGLLGVNRRHTVVKGVAAQVMTNEQRKAMNLPHEGDKAKQRRLRQKERAEAKGNRGATGTRNQPPQENAMDDQQQQAHEANSTEAQNDSTPVAPTIELTAVVSTRISGIGYDPNTQTLALRFVHNDARVYHYHGVPEEAWNALCAAQSKGAYFAANIANRYAYDRVEADMTISKSWRPEDVNESAPLAA